MRTMRGIPTLSTLHVCTCSRILYQKYTAQGEAPKTKGVAFLAYIPQKYDRFALQTRCAPTMVGRAAGKIWDIEESKTPVCLKFSTTGGRTIKPPPHNLNHVQSRERAAAAAALERMAALAAAAAEEGDPQRRWQRQRRGPTRR